MVIVEIEESEWILVIFLKVESTALAEALVLKDKRKVKYRMTCGLGT